MTLSLSEEGSHVLDFSADSTQRRYKIISAKKMQQRKT